MPFHAGGIKKGLTVKCTAKDHILAHYYRFITYGELGDKVCFQMRKNQTMSVSDRSALGIAKMRKIKICFFSSQWQSTQGSKKRKVDKSPKQKKQCQKMGIANQKFLLNKLLTKTSIWSYNDKNICFYTLVKPQDSFVELLNQLGVDCSRDCSLFIN